MNTSSAEDEINPTENSDDALLDSLGASVKKLISKGKDRGYITVDELNNALPPENEQIEDVMAMISDMGINIVENEEESEEEAPSGSEDDDTGFKLDEVESSRTIPYACICAKWAPLNFCPAKAKSPSQNVSKRDAI